ncbi:MAG: rhamnogalacturonan acetylesterase [Lachnospiraceae bacterium]|nr:rhamnogalacturonan acetylesterase [Lachnospiraceae bacterium]
MKEYRFQQFDRKKSIQKAKGDFLWIPELSDGFDPSLPQGVSGSGLIPVSFFTEAVPFGIYQISLEFTAEADISQLFLFTGRKQLRKICSLKKGERFSAVYYQSAAEIIPRYQEKAFPVSRLFFTICTRHPKDIRLGECSAVSFPNANPFRIFLCGDSTVTDHTSQLPYHPGACYAAWGQTLPAFLCGPAAVENQAHCGLTTEDFRKEGHWDLVLCHMKEGDICLFQFGHNDQKLPHLWTNGEYPKNLARFIQETRKKGAFPVLVTPLGRNTWDKNGTYLDLLNEHAQAVIAVGNDNAVPVIDLHRYSVAAIKTLGMDASRCYFHPDDYTHTNEYGACLFARWMAEELAKRFPERLDAKENIKDFTPPPGLWEMLDSGAAVCRPEKSCSENKELFDQMEKSTAGLLEVIAQAKKQSEI